MPINPALLSWSLHALTNRHGTERPKSRYIAATGPLHTRAHLGMSRAELSRCSEECTGHAGDRAQIGTRVPERVKLMAAGMRVCRGPPVQRSDLGADQGAKLRADRRHGPPAARRSSLCPSRGWPRLDEEPVKACRADLRVRPEPVTLDPRRRAPSGRAADDRGAEDRGAGELAPPLLGVVLSVAGHDEVLVSVDELAHDVEVPACTEVSVSTQRTTSRVSDIESPPKTSAGGHQRGGASRSTVASTSSLRAMRYR